MDVIENLRVLEDLDNETAVTIIQLALEDLSQLFQEDQGTAQQRTNSEARRALERRRDELQRLLRRRGGAPLATAGRSGSASTLPAHEPVQPQAEQDESNQTVVSERTSTSIYRIPGAWPSDEGSSQLQSQVREILRAVPQLMCHICMDEFDLTDGLTLSCGHHCCRDCLNEIYRGATADESRYPPRCCASQSIPLEQSRPLLEAQVFREFVDKQGEWETRNRVYCSNRNCGAFIRPVNIRGRDARCTSCRTRTCAECKKATHAASIPCATDEELRGALNVLERNHWRRCKGCRNGIERTYGCNHMVCSCGRQFCYQCGLPWKTCGCPLFPNDMVRNIDQPAVQPMEAGQENHEAWEQRLMGEIVRDNEGDDAWEQHLREHGIIRGDQQVSPAEDRQREALREREREREGRGFEYTIRIMRMQNEIEEFRSRVTRLRTQTEKIHHRRMSASDRRNLMELDVEIMELEAQIKKLERELQAVTGPADSATLPSLWGDTPYTSWKTLD